MAPPRGAIPHDWPAFAIRNTCGGDGAVIAHRKIPCSCISKGYRLQALHLNAARQPGRTRPENPLAPCIMEWHWIHFQGRVNASAQGVLRCDQHPVPSLLSYDHLGEGFPMNITHRA